MLFFKRPVVQLPKLTTPSGAELAAKAKSSPASQALLKPGMTSSEYIHALEESKQSVDAVNALAHGLPERDAVSWACQSSQKVADKLNPEEAAAARAAEAWVQDPTEATKAAAAEAASKTDFSGPGGWAAQAAAWSASPVPAADAAAAAVPGAPAIPSAPAVPSLAPAAVAGSVLLAAGLVSRPPMPAPQKPDLTVPPKPELEVPTLAAPELEVPVAPPPPEAEIPPIDQPKMAKPLQPFIDLGKLIAGG